MKFYRVVIIFALVAMCGLGWAKYVMDISATNARYNKYVKTGDAEREKGLYQLAAESYKTAADIRQSEQIYETVVAVYEEWYADEPIGNVKKGLNDAYSELLSKYPKKTAYWEKYVQNYMDADDYTEVVEIVRRAADKKVTSENLTSMYKKAYYATKLNGSGYPNITLGTQNAVYTYSNGSKYGALNAKGGDLIRYSAYDYISPAGAGGILLVKNMVGECFVVSTSGVKMARFTADVAETKAPGGNLLAVRLQGHEEWCYLNYDGEEQFGGFLNAGCFNGGMAPVQLSDGQWTFVDEKGNLSNDRWDGILLNESGNYLMGQCMITQKGEKWTLVNIEDKTQTQVLTCDEIDISRGEAIAFKENGLWGFADKTGKVLITPTYEKAHSFSAGVAAVSVDGLWGFVNTQGEMVVEPAFADAGYFDAAGGTCPVKLKEDGLWQLLAWTVSR